MSQKGLARMQWMDGEKGRVAYVGSAVHGRLPGVGAFMIIADDSETLEMLWDIVVGNVSQQQRAIEAVLNKSSVKVVGVCSIDHINEMAGT